MNVRRSLGLSLLQKYLTLVVSFGATMYVSRLITPEEMGVFFLSAGLLLICGTLAQLGIGGYLVQERELTKDRAGTALGLLVVSSISAAALLFAARDAIADFYGEPGVAAVIAVLSLTFVLVPFNSPQVALLQREMRFDSLLKIGLAGTVFQAATAATLAYHGFSYMSLAWAAVAEQIGITLAVLLCRPAYGRLPFRLGEWRRVLGVGSALSVSALAHEIGKAAPMLALGRAVSLEATGLFTRAQTVTDLYFRGVLQGIIPVLMPVMAKLAREGSDIAKPAVLTLTHMGVLAWPFFAVLALLAEPVLRILFGPQWGEAAPVLQVLCVLGAMTPITIVARQILAAIGQAGLEMRIQVATQVVRVALVVGLASWGMIAVAWALVASQALMVVALLVVLNRTVGLRMRDLGIPLLQTVATTLLAVAGPWLVTVTFGRDYGAFALVAACGPLAALGWLAGVVATRHPLRDEIARALSFVFARIRR